MKLESRRMMIALLIISAGIAVTLFLSFGTSRDCGTSKECFIREAQACGSAFMLDDFGTSKVRYSAKGCILTKEVYALPASEPDLVIELFRGKSMTCQYGRNNFDTRMIDTLTSGIAECDGELKDIIYDVTALNYLMS